MVEVKQLESRRRRRRRTPVDTESDGGGSASDERCEEMPVRSSDAGSSGGKTSRCSVRQLCALIETFNELKKQLVREIGFEGLLELPAFHTLNRQFSMWLLTKLDCEGKCIVTGDGRRIPFLPEDVNYAFGIPCGEKDVLGADALISDKGIQFMQECIGLSGVSAHSLKPVHEFLLSDLGDNPSTLQKDSFKIAFVVFAMGTFLAPSTKHDYAPTSFWGALRCTSEIPKYNWCAYVLKVLVDCARKVQSDIAKKREVSSISGCHLFLQILYLDNISIPGLSTPHDVFPRIKSFGSDTLNMFIAADTHENGFGRHQIRDSESVCYTWKNSVSQKVSIIASKPEPCPPSALGTTKTPNPPLVHNTPGSAANPAPPLLIFNQPSATDLFHLIRDKYPDLADTHVADLFKLHNARTLKHISTCQGNLLRENLNLVDNFFAMIKDDTLLDKRACSRTATKGASVSSLEKSNIVGRRLDLNDCEAESPLLKDPLSGGKAPAELPGKRNSRIPPTSSCKKTRQCTPTASQGSSHNGDDGLQGTSSTGAMDRSIWRQPKRIMYAESARDATVERMQSLIFELAVKAAESNNVPGRTLYGHCDKSPVDSRRIRQLHFVKPAWEMGAIHPHFNPNDVDQLFAWCRDDAQLYIMSAWVTHAEHRFIQLKGLDIKRQIVQTDNMGCDMCDMVIRRFKQYDHVTHAGICACWPQSTPNIACQETI